MYSSSLSPKARLAGLVLLLFIILTLPLAIFNAQRSQNVMSKAATVNSLTVFAPGSVPGCQFQTADAPVNVAFCDTFDQAMGVGNRSGDANGLVWGTSRVNGNTNPSQGFNDGWQIAEENQCGTAVSVRPEGDVHICNGQLVEAVNDGGSTSLLAMYPTQPFDITGRTGTVVFDVNADSAGGHSAWPAFTYTNQPVPAPYGGLSAVYTFPQNSFGFSIALRQPCGAQSSGIDSAWVTNNYTLTNLPLTFVNNCIQYQAGALNHFEVRLSVSQVDIYGTDAGSTILKHLVTIPNINLPLQRGLIWIEDAHYNGNKDGFNQSNHTFDWKNVGFDGPILPGDIHLDVNDAVNPPDPRDGSISIGWGVPDTTSVTPLSLQVPGATAQALSQATGALLTLNYFVYQSETLTYRINGNARTTLPYPFTDGLFGMRTIGIPIDKNQLVAGNNTLDFQLSPFGGAIANVDLILLGARPITCYDPSNCSGTPITSQPTLTPTPCLPNCLPTVTLPPSPSPTATSTPTPTNTPTVPPSPTPTTTARIPGDLNPTPDGKVCIDDLSIMAKDWMRGPSATPPTTLFNPLSDINGDGIVDIKDLSILAAHWSC